jgi:hypothetical protein
MNTTVALDICKNNFFYIAVVSKGDLKYANRALCIAFIILSFCLDSLSALKYIELAAHALRAVDDVTSSTVCLN